MRILFVEDNPRLRSLIGSHLRARGFAVDAVGRADDAGTALATTSYDIVLLDLGLPDADGSAVLVEAQRRSGGQLPVIVVTARDDLGDRIRLLNQGADDFIVKPFDMLELEARLHAVLRRPGMRTARAMICGDLTMQIGSGEVSVGERRLDVARREFALLEELMRAGERTVVRQTLEDRLYAFDEAVTPNALEQSVSRLRRRLADAGSTVTIETRRGIGYRLAPGGEQAQRSA
jgi:two-component system, OmpR family, response regulator QseB